MFKFIKDAVLSGMIRKSAKSAKISREAATEVVCKFTDQFIRKNSELIGDIVDVLVEKSDDTAKAVLAIQSIVETIQDRKILEQHAEKMGKIQDEIKSPKDDWKKSWEELKEIFK